ncbi:MAG: ATP synthase F1 subunit delta [Deltaproteobacteria bacterium]|jgi:F-type H+-transporting ATPase subunit delta|nr:ATP synthase F1 subunit delta [Deltaproteobacteria bacterium]
MHEILAKRYAKALLSLGQEDGKYREYGAELSGFLSDIEATGEAGRALVSPFYPKDQRGKALAAILEKGSLSQLVKNFVNLLHDKGRLDILGPIVQAYSGLCDELEGLVRGTLTSATPLSDSQISAIKGALNAMSGSKVELEVKVDPSIIGGLVARLGDLVVDSSLQTQIKLLGQKLSEPV